MTLLPSGSQFRAIVSGQRRGLGGSLLRLLLAGAEYPYSWAVRRRNRRFDTGRTKIHNVGVPVISVGNLTLGGTGKTPMVAYLARGLHERGLRVTLISRGYGAEQGSRNDEALELELTLPDVPHLQNPDRVAAAAMAIEEFECQAILLDDGFQHRRLHRDLDIVLLDALEPFGFDHVFPRGTLREPLAGLRRAQVVVLSRADMVSAEERRRIQAVAARHAPAAVWVEARHAPQSLVNSSGETQPLDALAGRRVAAFSGIGNPAAFRHTLADCGYSELVGFREFPDHYNYQRADVESLASWSVELKAQALVCTRKDLVKLGVEQIGDCPLWAVAVGLEILSGQADLERCLTAVASNASAGKYSAATGT